MVYTLGKTCAKKLCKRTVLLQFIIENAVTCFLERMSVEADKNLNAKLLGLYGNFQVKQNSHSFSFPCDRPVLFPFPRKGLMHHV